MKAAPLAGLVALALFAPSASGAEDTVHVCIAASTAGQTFRKDGKLLAARDQMIACARDACPPIVRSHCARWLSEIDAAIPSVVVRAEDPSGDDVLDASLSIDGRPGKLDGQPVRLDPGEHLVAIESADGAHKEERVLVAAGETSRVVTLRLPAPASASAPSAPPPAPSESAPASGRTTYVPAGAWVVGGAGILVLGAATFFGVSANSDLNNLNATCSPHCPEAQTDPGRTDAALFYVSLGVGGAAVATALVWALAFPSHSPAPSPSPSTSTGTASAPPRVELRPVAALVAGGALLSLELSY